jgi:hypothetical protein
MRARSTSTADKSIDNPSTQDLPRRDTVAIRRVDICTNSKQRMYNCHLISRALSVARAKYRTTQQKNQMKNIFLQNMILFDAVR